MIGQRFKFKISDISRSLASVVGDDEIKCTVVSTLKKGKDIIAQGVVWDDDVSWCKGEPPIKMLFMKDFMKYTTCDWAWKGKSCE